MYNPYKSAFQAAIAELTSQEARRFYRETAIEHTFLTAAVMFIGIFKFIQLANNSLKLLRQNNEATAVEVEVMEAKAALALPASNLEVLALPSTQVKGLLPATIDIDFWSQEVEEILPVLEIVEEPQVKVKTMLLLPAAKVEKPKRRSRNTKSSTSGSDTTSTSSKSKTSTKGKAKKKAVA